MSVYNNIINGTYNKKKRSIADEIINGTYQQNQEELQKATSSILDIKNKRDNVLQNVFSKKEDILPTIVPTVNNQSNWKNIKANTNDKGDILPKVITDEKLLKKSNENQTSDLLPTLLAGVNYFGQGAIKGAEGLFDSALQLGTSKLNPYYWFNPDKLENHQQIAKEIIQKDTTHDLITKLSGDENFNQNVLDRNSMIKENNIGGGIAKSLGQMSMSLATGNENIGLGLMGVQSYGGGLEEAYNQGADRRQANLYGIMNSAIETASEKMFGGIGGLVGEGPLDDMIKKKLTKNISSAVTKRLAEAGVDMVGEGVEELASDLLQPIAQKLTYASEEDLIKLYQDQNYLEDFISGTLSAGVLQGVTLPSQIKAINNQSQNQIAPLPKLNKDNVNVIKEDVANNQNIANIQNEIVSDNKNLPTTKTTQEKPSTLANSIATPSSTSKMQGSGISTTLNNNITNFNENWNQDNIFSKQVDEVVAGTYPSKNMLVVSETTPKILQDIGLNNLPITMTQRHLKTIMNSSGEYKGANYHDLGIDLVKQLPQAIAKPLNILKSNTNSNSIVVVTELADKQDRPVIASIKIDGTGIINDIEIDSNVLTSAYGRNNYDNFMKKNIEEGNLLYDIDDGIIKRGDGKLQLRPTTSYRKNSATVSDANIPKLTSETNSGTNSLDSNITQFENSVKFPSVNNMQQNEVNIPTYKDIKRDKIPLPSIKNNDNVLKIASMKIANEINNNINVKERSWINTSTESEILKGKVLIEDLDVNKINYEIQSNKSSLEKANSKLNSLGYDESLKYVQQLINNEKIPSASDMALAQRVLQEASKKGNVEIVQDLLMDIAILGTDLGQATQALSMIQRMTPEGQLKMYTKIVQRAKNRGEKAYQNVQITPEMVKNILESYNQDGTYDQNDLNKRVEQFKQDIANQLKTTTIEKVDAWRYLSMLGNPKTHIRNVVSNIAMKGAITYKNAVARTTEMLLPLETKTKTWRKSSEVVKKFANQTAIDMKSIITGEAKYNEKTTIESKKQTFKKGIATKGIEKAVSFVSGKDINFKNGILENLSNFNSNALEAEDWFFSKSAFKNTFQEYLTANGIVTENDIQNNPKIIEQAKQYAVEQAEIATFRQYSKLASQINQIERNNKLAKFATGATIPFKKTPINVAKAMVKYSPLGLIKNVSYDVFQLQKGSINASQFIDNLSQGLTGTSLVLLGYALAKAGFLSGAGDDDKEGKFDSYLGKQSYALNIGGNSYSISWLSPIATPFLVGANVYEKLEEGAEWNPDVIINTLAETLDPLSEMSFVSSLTNVLNSYNSGSATMIKDIGETATQSYILQFFPTLFSQMASTLDDKKRSTKVSNNSSFKFGEETARKIMYKIPGLRNQLEVATDIWGNEKEQSSNIIERAMESFIIPYSKTKDISTDLDKEIKSIYNATGNTGVIPNIPYAYTKYGATYRMSAIEYIKFKKTYGQNSSKYLNELITSNSYKKATDEEKAKMIDNVYDYARALANKEYFDSIDVDYSSDILTKMKYLNQTYGINASTYYANKEQYDYAYNNPEKYAVIKQITSYDKYNQYSKELNRIRENTSDKKLETLQYINNLKLNIPQKAMMIKMYYLSYNDYNEEIINYINKQKGLSVDDKTIILTKLGFTVRDGKVIT